MFDERQRQLRRDRAFRSGPRLFLLERAFEDLLERLSFVRRKFASALLLGCPDPAWPDRLAAFAERVTIVEPGPLFSAAAPTNAASGPFDLALSIGLLDTASDVPGELGAIHAMLGPDSLFAGAFAGNESFPLLRSVMRAADEALGIGASPRVHPRIEASAVAPLLQDAGFVMPVVDIDRVRLRYRSFDQLVGDLRGMGGTNILQQRSRRFIGKTGRDAALYAFADRLEQGAATEVVEIVHFAAWTPGLKNRA